MKKLTKMRLGNCFFLIIFILISISVHTASAADGVCFGLRFEDTASETGTIRKAYFNLKKGTENPVCVSVSLKYDGNIYEEVKEEDIKPLVNLNKTITKSLGEGNDGFKIIRVSVGLEDLINNNTNPLPEGDNFTVNFKVRSGKTQNDNSIAFNTDNDLGTNQASTKEPRLLVVATESGDVLDPGTPMEGTDLVSKATNGSSNSCFINLLYTDSRESEGN